MKDTFWKEFWCCHIWNQTDLQQLSSSISTYRNSYSIGTYKKRHFRKAVHETCLKCGKTRIWEEHTSELI